MGELQELAVGSSRKEGALCGKLVDTNVSPSVHSMLSSYQTNDTFFKDAWSRTSSPLKMQSFYDRKTSPTQTRSSYPETRFVNCLAQKQSHGTSCG